MGRSLESSERRIAAGPIEVRTDLSVVIGLPRLKRCNWLGRGMMKLSRALTCAGSTTGCDIRRAVRSPVVHRSVAAPAEHLAHISEPSVAATNRPQLVHRRT